MSYICIFNLLYLLYLCFSYF